MKTECNTSPFLNDIDGLTKTKAKNYLVYCNCWPFHELMRTKIVEFSGLKIDRTVSYNIIEKLFYENFRKILYLQDAVQKKFKH